MEILVADIGGTNSRFALFHVEKEGAVPIVRLTAERRQATRMVDDGVVAALSEGDIEARIRFSHGPAVRSVGAPVQA